MFIYRKHFVRKHERAMLFHKGDFVRFLDPGTHYFFDPMYRKAVMTFDISNTAEFQHRLEDFLVKEHATEMTRVFEVIETGDHEVAAIYKNGRLTDVIGPNERQLFFKGVYAITAKLFNIRDDFVVEEDMAKLLGTARAGAMVAVRDATTYVREVPDGHIGMLYVDGELVDELAPGIHAFFKFARNVGVDLMDMRVRTLDVGGQEILTKDKVALRINLTATFKFVDAVKAVREVKDPLDYLYKEIQFGLRAAVGTRTLDALLEDKGVIDRIVFDHVHDKFAEMGVEVTGVGVKDIILPGEMKELLGKVVEAEKAAQANVIRRREETNATRSLMNTAKLMEDNPIALRMKELEMLEKGTENVGNISVYGGLDGVLDELVRIKR